MTRKAKGDGIEFCGSSDMIVKISGVAYHAACSTHASGVPKEEGWPEPTARRVGKGWQFVYEVTAEQAEQIASHCEDVGTSFLTGTDDPETRAEGRALLAAARRIRGA